MILVADINENYRSYRSFTLWPYNDENRLKLSEVAIKVADNDNILDSCMDYEIMYGTAYFTVNSR